MSTHDAVIVMMWRSARELDEWGRESQDVCPPSAGSCFISTRATSDNKLTTFFIATHNGFQGPCQNALSAAGDEVDLTSHLIVARLTKVRKLQSVKRSLEAGGSPISSHPAPPSLIAKLLSLQSSKESSEAKPGQRQHQEPETSKHEARLLICSFKVNSTASPLRAGVGLLERSSHGCGRSFWPASTKNNDHASTDRRALEMARSLTFAPPLIKSMGRKVGVGIRSRAKLSDGVLRPSPQGSVAEHRKTAVQTGLYPADSVGNEYVAEVS